MVRTALESEINRLQGLMRVLAADDDLNRTAAIKRSDEGLFGLTNGSIA